MGDDCELEEGEMKFSSDQGVVDPDVDLSYIDKKVQNVLGHLQKEFEMGALNLCGPSPTIGEYGSFLPTYKRSPAVPSCQKNSLGNHIVQRVSNNLPGKNVVQKFTSLPATSCKQAINQDPQNDQTSGSLFAQAPGKIPIKKGNARIPGNGLSDHKPIRVRIKMGTEILSQKVAMVCKDLGLDASPNSPPGNSHDDSSRMLPHTSMEKTSECPFRILQEMTAIPVPEDQLMSPLPDSLRLLKEKEKQYTLSVNQPALKTGKEPSIQTKKKSSDVLCCEETPSGSKRKTVDCFNDPTWNETSSVSEMKKHKKNSTGQLAREKSTCGLGGASSTIDGLTTKRNVQEGIKKDGKGDPRVAFGKLNKIKVVGMHAVKEKKTCLTKLQQKSSENRVGDKFLSEMPSKDALYIGHNSMDVGFESKVAASSTSVDNWAQCDSCEKWRLLPLFMKPEELPDKWLCSMQTWMPGMNHCGVSEEETTNAIKTFNASEARCPETGGKLLSDASNADKSYQPLTSGSLPNLIEKKSNMKDLSQGVSSNILVDAVKPMNSNPNVCKIKKLKLPGETPNATQISTGFGVSPDFVQDKIGQKLKRQSAGTGCLIKKMKKKEGGKQESDGSKHITTGGGNKLVRDIKVEEIDWNQDSEWTPEERKTKRQKNDRHTLDEAPDTKKRLLASKSKPAHKPQLPTASGSLCTKAHGRINNPVTKIRLMDNKQGKDGNKLNVFADGNQKESSMVKATTAKISVQESKAYQRNEMFQADGSQEHRNADTSCRYFSGGSGQIAGVETSSSPKVLGSNKSGRMFVEEVKASAVESVSSCLVRSSCPTNLASPGESTSRKKQNMKYGEAGCKIVKDRKSLSQDDNCEIFSTTHPTKRKQPKPEACKENPMSGDLPCTNMKTVFKSGAGIKNLSATTHETKDGSGQAADDILQEAEKLKKLADCFKSSGFDSEYKETNFKAALRFLFGASLLEMCSTENVKRATMSHIEAYNIAAKLSESCARQYETSQEMAAAVLAYKCSEVACMRLAYTRSSGLSGEWNELQRLLQMTPQGESPSSSASDIDSFNHQGMIDKSAKTKRDLSHVIGNLLPVAGSQLNFASLLDFTENMNLAMEASAKSQNAFKAVTSTLDETKHGDCISAIRKVVDFSFHNVEALVKIIEVAMDALTSSSLGDPKC